MRVNVIAAIGKNGELGGGGKLLWHLPEDFKHFKETTMGKPVIMGRATYESIGRALPGRLNIILTRDSRYSQDGCEVAHSLEEAVSLARQSDSDEVFIIGGANVYKQALESGIVDRLYLTLIDAEFDEADTYFPEYGEYGRVVEERECIDKPEDIDWGYKFVTLER